MSAWKRTTCVEMLTVLISTGRDLRVSGRSVGNLVSADFTICIKICLLPEVLSLTCSWRTAEESGDTKAVAAECNRYKSVLSRCFETQ